MKFILILAALFSWDVTATVVEFSLPSKDRVTQIHGQIDKADCGKAVMPAVMLVGGAGLFTRNVFLGHSGTERDKLFADIGTALESACTAVIRLDHRGVSCDVTGATKTDGCVDQKLRATVSDETILDDIQVVYDYAKSQDFIDTEKFFMIGHSEGSLNISRLVARGSVRPNGILFFGGMTESPAALLKWQMTDRYVDWMFEMDTNQDGVLTNVEIIANYESSRFNRQVPVEVLLSSAGAWTRETLTTYFVALYENLKTDALNRADDEAFVKGGVVYSSYKWWKRWLTDDSSVLANLKDYGGPIRYFNGDRDALTPGRREKDFLDATTIPMKSQLVYQLVTDKGHSLGDDEVTGPMDEAYVKTIVETISNWL